MKKENLLFPYLEAHGITAPPKVMWGVDDEIRAAIKEALAAAETGGKDRSGLDKAVRTALEKIREMIFKEDNILRPMLLETLTQEEWARVAGEGAELGFCLIPTPPFWKPADTRQAVSAAPATGDIRLPTGVFSTAELTHLLDTLPVDVTFVDKDDTGSSDLSSALPLISWSPTLMVRVGLRGASTGRSSRTEGMPRAIGSVTSPSMAPGRAPPPPRQPAGGVGCLLSAVTPRPPRALGSWFSVGVSFRSKPMLLHNSLW